MLALAAHPAPPGWQRVPGTSEAQQDRVQEPLPKDGVTGTQRAPLARRATRLGARVLRPSPLTRAAPS